MHAVTHKPAEHTLSYKAHLRGAGVKPDIPLMSAGKDEVLEEGEYGVELAASSGPQLVCERKLQSASLPNKSLHAATPLISLDVCMPLTAMPMMMMDRTNCRDTTTAESYKEQPVWVGLLPDNGRRKLRCQVRSTHPGNMQPHCCPVQASGSHSGVRQNCVGDSVGCVMLPERRL
jgi:hypothetical protein